MQINTAASEWNLVGDFNGDGKADIAAILPSSVPKNYVLNPHSLYVNYATGSGFSTVEYPNVPVMTAPGGWNRVADFSGDGKADFIYLGALTSSGWWGTLSKSTASLDLIDSFSNGLGGLSTIDYTPSTRYANTQLPFPLQTVSKITTNDGNGNNSITGYTYSGGFYHIGERDFRGFNYAKITGPTGPNNEQKITETWFHQGNDTAVYANNPNVLSGYMKGKPYLTQVSDLLGRIYSKMEIIYATDRNNAAPWFNPPLQVDTAICSAGNFTGYCKSSGGAKLLRTVYKYDDYSDVITDELGNVTLEYQYGDLTDATDDRTITRTFSPNTTKWIVGLPSGESVYQGIGTTTKVAGKTYYYDDLSSCAAVPTNNQTPVKGNLTRFVNWLNGGTSLETRMAYDPYGNPSCGRDANGNTSMITYDASHTFPKTTTNPLSQQTTTQYYGVDGIAADYGLYGQVKSVTDPNDSTITRIYDKLGRITKIADPYTTAYSSLDTYGTVSYQYLNFGTVGQQKVVTLTTEKADNLTAPYCPPGVNSYYDGVQYNMCKSAYYGCYSSLFSTNCHCPSGYFYIGGGTCLAYPYCPTGGYFDPGQDACRSPNYVWSENYFDGLGRTYKTRKEGPDGKVIVTETMYDGRGAVAKTSLPYFEGTETPRYQTFTYDSVGRTTQITKKDAANNVVSVTKACYDTNITVLLDENSHRKRETRDALGRLIKVEEYTGTYPACTTDAGAPYATTGYVYDVMNNLRYVTDAKGNQTEMRYNTLGRKYYMSDPDMGSWYYTYDGNGNLITQKDARNQTITFTYDALNRLKIKDYPTGTDVNYTYDETASSYPVGRLTSMSDESGATRYHYDKLGRTVKSEKTAGGVNYPLEFTYDIMGRATSLKYPDGEIVGYGYDPSGNLAQAIGYATYSGFNALGQPGSLAYGNGVNTTYAYYPTHSRLQNITTKKDTLSLQNLSYGYDNRGNINGISNLLDTTRSQILSYDDLDRLKTAQSTSYGSLSYNYDQIGNITLKEGVTYTPYPGKAHAIGSTSSGRTYTYDNNGNITSDGTRTFTYTFDNMPRTINGNITFLYDGDGNRAKKTTSAYSSVYIDKLYECTTTGGATSCAKYIFAGDQRIAVKTAAETLYYHPDHLGSTALATDGTGVSKEVITYYPYGKTKSDTGTANLDHKYTSQELDGEVGLYNYGARLYDPEIGRFITPDTIIPDPANPQSLNRYSYVLNNPIMYTDPNGRFPWAAIFIGALIGTVSSGIQSDWDIGAMLAGGVIGGVAGGVGGYMGGLYNGAVGGAAAGATAGGLSSAYYGGNVMDGILKGAVIGGIGGAAFEGIGAYYGNTWNLGRVGVYGLAGGGLSELAGGNFAEGFMYAFALAVSAYSYSSSTVDF
jgi:RHS repeat-associated protein